MLIGMVILGIVLLYIAMIVYQYRTYEMPDLIDCIEERCECCDLVDCKEDGCEYGCQHYISQ